MNEITRREAIERTAVGVVALTAVTGGQATGSELSAVPPTSGDAMDEKTLQKLIETAKAAASNAYCPYSHFPVGAAVLSEDGDVLAGCNVENASYGLTICAERNAIFQMIQKGKKRIQAVVIYTPTPTPSAPCGACRQVINEFGANALVVSTCDGAEVLRKQLSELLPAAFGPANLGN